MAPEKLLPGGGEMARRVREFDWQASALGSPSDWPKSLATAVHICLTSRFPAALWWGKELRVLYNDAWRPMLGRTRHPGALGAPGREASPEIWHVIGPMLEGVLAKGEATGLDNQLVPLDRNGYLEEAYFTYSCSPIPDERGGVGGVFAAVNETTHKVLAERRLRTLRELAAQRLQAKGAVEAARMAMATLAANASDLPFALLYLVEPDGRARLEQSSPAGVESTDGRWPVAEAIERGEPILLKDLQRRIGQLPSAWPVPPDHALVLPLRGAAQGRVLAVLVLGVNPARDLDEEHRGFLDMAARHIADTVTNASAYEEEPWRAEARTGQLATLEEDRLRRSEQALNDFFETASVGLHWVGPDGIILRVNPAELELLGYAKEQYVGRHIADFHVERAVIDDILARLTRGERLHDYPAQMRGKDGSIRDVLINSSVLFENGKFIHTRCFTLDVTARKRAEANLHARARQQQAVASLGELALRERDLQKVFERATAAVAETLEVEYCKVLELLPGGKEVLLRAGVGWKAGLVGSARVGTGMDSQAGYTLAAGAPVIVRDLGTEERFHGPALLTEHAVVSGMSCIIRGADGAPWGVLGTHARRRIEFTDDDVSFLTAVANILGHAIQRERAEAALRESDRRKDEFIAMLSHELRNPLAPLRSGLEILRLRAAGGDEQVRAMMERQVNHLVRLVDDLLESSRISRGLVELRRETVQLAEVLRSAVEAAQPLVREAEHRLEVELPHEPLWVRGDTVRLSQSFANLLNNAARYTPRGGSIWLRATREPDGSACVSVRDTGAGFAPQAKERMFQLFSRGEGSSGLGIGLSLVRMLVEMHGGRVEARSEGEGRGAEFLVRLPPAPPPPGAARQQMIRADGRTYRVLVADDNRDAAESLAMLLRTLGNEVNVAYDGVEAVQAARDFQPHVVLLDIGMPRLDGYGAAREIRRQPLGERVRLVALTGWGQEEDRRRAREAGFDSHIVKPAELDALQRVLADVRPENLH